MNYLANSNVIDDAFYKRNTDQSPTIGVRYNTTASGIQYPTIDVPDIGTQIADPFYKQNVFQNPPKTVRYDEPGPTSIKDKLKALMDMFKK